MALYDCFVVLVIVGSCCFHSCFVDCRRIKRIINGTPVGCGYEPRVASLRNATSEQHLCGATVVSAHWAITAAHCVRAAPEAYRLRLNNWCDSKPDASVDAFILYPEYNKYTDAHDIALIKISLDVDVDDTSWLDEDILPTSSFGLEGDCTVFGYGVTSTTSPDLSEDLVAAQVTVVSLDECTERLNYLAPDYDSGMMCGIGDHSDSCQGDSGGPLLCGSRLAGVVSTGVSCAVEGLPAIFTNVGAHLSWIRSQLH